MTRPRAATARFYRFAAAAQAEESPVDWHALAFVSKSDSVVIEHVGSAFKQSSIEFRIFKSFELQGASVA